MNALFRFAETETKDFEGVIEAMAAKVENRLYCRILEWKHEDGKVTWDFCQIMGESDVYIAEFAGLIGKLKGGVNSLIPASLLPDLPDGHVAEVFVLT